MDPPEAEVVVLSRHRPANAAGHRFIQADLNDPECWPSRSRAAPDFDIHTAGKTPPASDEELYRANFWSTTHLLGGPCVASGKPIRVILAGSAAELESTVDARHLPVGEDYPADPVDALTVGASSSPREAGWRNGRPFQVICARIFNVIGPGLPPTQAFGRVCRATRRSRGRTRSSMPVGRLDTRRDFVDVRDVARGHDCGSPCTADAGQLYHVGTSGLAHRRPKGSTYLVKWSGRSVASSRGLGP